jgi:hypothetical protein
VSSLYEIPRKRLPSLLHFLGFACERCGLLDAALKGYENILVKNGGGGGGRSISTRVILAAAHVGLGWVCIHRQQPLHSSRTAFQVAHVHFLTGQKYIGGSGADILNNCSDYHGIALMPRLYRGLVTSLADQRSDLCCRCVRRCVCVTFVLQRCAEKTRIPQLSDSGAFLHRKSTSCRPVLIIEAFVR